MSPQQKIRHFQLVHLGCLLPGAFGNKYTAVTTPILIDIVVNTKVFVKTIGIVVTAVTSTMPVSLTHETMPIKVEHNVR